jgi:hypothetical protein
MLLYLIQVLVLVLVQVLVQEMFHCMLVFRLLRLDHKPIQ